MPLSQTANSASEGLEAEQALPILPGKFWLGDVSP
jgi:hypothetical protein